MKKSSAYLLSYAKNLILPLLLLGIIQSLYAQPKMSLWYDATAKYTSGHHHNTSKEIPCDWIYYRTHDGKNDTLHYGIRNEGDAPLTLDLPLVFEDNLFPDFSMLTQPDKSVLQSGEDAHFKVAYQAPYLYRPVRANLPIASNDPNAGACGIQFWVGGMPPPPTEYPFCFQNVRSEQDFNNDMVIDQIINNAHTFDDKGNIIGLVATLESPVGTEIGRRTITNTYDANNNLLTNQIINTGIYAVFNISINTTNTYDANNNLLTNNVVEVINPVVTLMENRVNTYDTNNNLISSVLTAIGPFGTNSLTTNYTYDANNNRLTETTLFPPFFSETIVNTYDANNNLLTTERIEVINPVLTIKENITNTYDANNNLLTETIVIDHSFAGIHNIMITNTYDANNKLLTVSTVQTGFQGDFEDLFTYTYDANLRVISQKEEYFSNPGRIKVGEIIFNVTPCDLPTPSIADPCNCFDPLNRKDNQDVITHFHDVLSITGTPGDVVVLQTGTTNFLDNNLVQISDDTNLGTIPASGVFEYDFFHASGASGAITLNVGGVLLNPFDISVCEAKSCIVIPTMSQWGLLIFGLLVLNIGLYFVKQKIWINQLY